MSIYPSSITTQEKELGFIIKKLKSGYGNIFGGDDLIEVVIKEGSAGDAIFKVTQEKYQYKFVLAGKDPRDINNWHPTEDRFYSLDELKSNNG